MSAFPWLLLSAWILLMPWLLRPLSRRRRPEIHGGLRVLWWINAGYCAFLHRLELRGMAPLPEHGPAILIANHTCGIDHMLLQAGSRRVLGFMIAQEFYDFWLCRPFCQLLNCIPVKRDGRDLAATRAALRALEQGRVVPIFPEGKILPTSGREIGEAKPGVAYLALRSRAPVIPAYIRGTPESRDVFRALAWPSHARLVFGPPIDLAPYYSENEGHLSREKLSQATDVMMDAIRALRDC